MAGKMVYAESLVIEASGEVSILLSNGDVLAGLERVQVPTLDAESPPRVDVRLLLHKKEHRHVGEEPDEPELPFSDGPHP